MIALKAAYAAAAIHRAESVSGRSVDEALEASEHGGRRAFEYLAALQSLRHIDATSVEELLQDAASAGICSREGSRHLGSAGGSPVAVRRSQSGGSNGCNSSPARLPSDLARHSDGAGRAGSPRAAAGWQSRPISLGRLPTQPSMRRAAEQPPGDAAV